MKNVQVIDGANNCTYSIFSFTDEEFMDIFPLPGQNIEFIEDVIERIGIDKVKKILSLVWSRIVDKKEVHGIHGTLFYELLLKKRYYPTKKEEEMIAMPKL
jgi:hypothetical protein